MTNLCRICLQQKPLDFYNKKNPHQCKTCISLRAKLWKETHKDSYKIAQAVYRLRNKDAKAAHESVRRVFRKLGTTITKDVEEFFFIQEAYHLAKLRSDMTGIKWHVDHIVPLKSHLVCGLHCISNLQVIPASTNIKKSNYFEIR